MSVIRAFTGKAQVPQSPDLGIEYLTTAAYQPPGTLAYKWDNGDVACDHYNRYEEDLDLLAGQWPLGSELLWVTLYHWDLPQALQDRYGGWLDTAESQRDFERYARLCYERFGDRVKRWITLNEPWDTSVNGYVRCTEPPGRGSGPNACAPGDLTTEPWIIGKSLIMAHARAARLYNVKFKPTQGGLIGASLNGDYFEPWDSADPRDHEAAERRMELAQDYPAEMRAQLSHRLPTFTKAEFALLREAEVDFYGMNYYTAQFARHREYPAPDTDYLGNIDEYQEDKNGISIGELSGIDWLRVAPRCFRKHLVGIYNKYKKPIYVTENRCPCPGEVTKEDCVRDTYRQRYLAEHLNALWSLLASELTVHLEWSSGYSVSFGLTYIDYATLQRTPKESALQIQGMIEQRTRMEGKRLQ
ncbi:glycoside hydrolase superfamily [Aspergillus tetrazonus]